MPSPTLPERRRGAKSFADDLVLGRGVVIGRAAATLRSVETHPRTRRFVRAQTGASPRVPGVGSAGGEPSGELAGERRRLRLVCRRVAGAGRDRGGRLLGAGGVDFPGTPGRGPRVGAGDVPVAVRGDDRGRSAARTRSELESAL